ncbi:efflux transporter outer membrane subunit [Xylophilus sp.]|uniref:efflux transporter outer membrane subunit n=1 Tax=Xylophilus sp. TaxID=2653893 RepID=UPI0013BAAE06|nr:efflux transporter outer membrane subunit [Xylophilus sp.]KAF1048902.1 MAG: Toxin and drug export protein A [Xylophilus sp.]
MTLTALLRPSALALALALAGCSSLRTAYEAPATAVPARWQHGPDAARDAEAATGGWWRAFGDPVLDALVEAALARSNDLAVAAIKVRSARLQARLEENRPTLSGSVSADASRSLDGGSTTRSNSASLSASYELDLWNRLGASLDAARWEAEATAEDREATAQTLVGTTATLYWQLAYYNQRLAAAAESIAYAERTLALVQAQYDAGSTSSLEVAESRQSLASQRATFVQLQQQVVTTSNSLAVLFDGVPVEVAVPGWRVPQALPEAPLPEVAAGLPAALLGRRPDLRAAELRLRKLLATADATRLAYYPQFSLTGALGGSSTTLGSVLSNPAVTLGAGLTLPFLNLTEMRLNTEVARNDYEKAVIDFRQTLYEALADVDNALSARRQYALQGEQLEQSLADARRIERLYEVRYRAGSVALSVWLDAQESRRTAETSLAENRLNRFANHATLFQALGGGV